MDRLEENGLQTEERFPNNCSFDPTRFYLSNDSADVHFAFEVNGQEIFLPAHKIILSLRSPVFHAMFFGDIKEIGNIKIADASVNGFKRFLALFYLNEVKVTGDTVFELTNLANKYDMPHGLEICEKYLITNTDTDEICTQLGFAIKYNLSKLQEYCKEKIQANATEVFNSDDFINTTLDVLRVILRLGDYNCFEIDVFYACMRWAENVCNHDCIDSTDPQNLRRVLNDCFYLIPFTAMNIEDFAKVLSSYKSLFTTEESSNIMVCIVKGASTEFTNKLSSNANNVRTFDWNQGLLSCNREGYSSMINVDEHTTFSSNHRLLFGAFRLFGIQNMGSDKPLSVTICVNRRGDTLLPNRLHEKIRFITTNSNRGDTILFKLEKPLIIKPHMKYTIHVSFSESEQLATNDDGDLDEWRVSATDYEQTHFLTSQGREDIHIKFYKDPEVSLNQFGSIISALYFNRL